VIAGSRACTRRAGASPRSGRGGSDTSAVAIAAAMPPSAATLHVRRTASTPPIHAWCEGAPASKIAL